MYNFICGCTTKFDGPWWVPPAEAAERTPIPTFDSIVYDEQGFLICLVHRLRKHGWRNVTMTGPQGNQIHDIATTHYRDAIIAGQDPNAGEIHSTCEDHRCNTDPEEIGQKMLALRKRFRRRKFHKIADEVMAEV